MAEPQATMREAGAAKRDAEEQRTKYDTREPIAKVIEIIGSSPESLDDAVRRAVKYAGESMRHITGVEVRRMSAEVRDNDIVEWRVDLKLAFGVERRD